MLLTAKQALSLVFAGKTAVPSKKGNGDKASKLLRVMKITAFILLIACMQVAAKGRAQTVTLDLKNVSVQKVITEVIRQTGVSIMYNEALFKDASPVTIKVKDASITEVLDKCLQNQSLVYILEGSMIVIKKKNDSGMASENTKKQPIDIRGRVENENGRPIPGVTVTVKGTKNATATNDNGIFELKGVDENAILVFTGVNIEPYEISVNGKNDLATLTLKTKVTTIESVTVSTGYQDLTKERATGSFVKIDNELYNRQVSTDALSRLEGITSSILVDKRQGANRYSMRGLSTLTSTISSILIVVDGFPYYGDINNINPNDIENVTLLRDAAAASVWGARAGNGVLVIVTKRGKFNQPFRATFNTNITIGQKPDLFYNKQMLTSEFIDVESFLFGRGYYNSNFTSNSRPVISPVVEILNKRKLGQITPADSANQIDALRALDVRNDFNKYIYRKSIYQQNSLAIQGGSAIFNFLISLGFDHNLDNLKRNQRDRYSVNSVNIIRPIRNLEIGVGITFTQFNTDNNNTVGYPINPGGNKNTLYPYARLMDTSGSHAVVAKDYRSVYTDTAGAGQLLDWKYRPLDELQMADNTIKVQHLQMQTEIRYLVGNFLTARIKYQHERQNSISKNDYSPESYFTRNLINRFTQKTGNTVKRIVPLGAILDQSSSLLVANKIRGQLDFERTLNLRHRITALLSGDISEVSETSSGNRVYGYDDNILTSANIDFVNLFPIYGNLSGSTAIPSNVSFGETVDRFVSVLANASYSYDDRYMAYASARKDATNLLGAKTNNKWTPLWSIGTGWILSNEKFYKTKFLPYLKLRASYGYTGNVNNSISALGIISYTGNNPYTNLPYAAAFSPPNPSLRWENVGILNLGLDFEVKNKRISGAIEYFRKKVTDVLSLTPVDPTTGFLNQTRNSAHLRGRGIDLQLNSNNLNGRLKWKTSFWLSHARTIVTKYLNKPSSISSAVGQATSINPIEGKLAYALVSYRFAGLDPATGNPQGYIGKQISTNYTAIANLPMADSNIVFSGSTLPLYYGAVCNTFTWKGFSVSANIQYKFAYYFRRSTILYNSLFSTWANPHVDYQKRWQKSGDETWTTVPSLIYPGNTSRDNFYANSEATVERGDHIRMRDISISYYWENKNTRKRPFHNARLYVVLNNVGVIWRANKARIDPDYPGLSNIPAPKSYSIGFTTEL